MSERPAENEAPDRPLQVAMDARFWPMSGLGTYTRELLRAFARLGAPVEWTLIGPPALREEMPEGLIIKAWIAYDKPVYSLGNLLRYPKVGPVDLLHYPHYNSPRPRGARCVTTVHDLFHLRYGNALKRRYQRHFLGSLRRRRGTEIIAVSEKTGRELVAAARIPAQRMTVIHQGPGRPAPLRPPGHPAGVRSAGETFVKPPWLLATGIDKPHKNFDFLLSALTLYYQRRPDAPPLVWAGPSEQECQRRRAALPALVRQRVALVPYTGDAALEALYAGACALVFPSLDEGFGFPPLEAMARGIPVVCARREPMTTLLADAPLYFEPTESASLWRMLDRLLDVESIREEVLERGRRQAACYSWDRTARETYRVYCKCAGLDA